MYATTHFVIGAAAGMLTNNPAAGFIAGCASHAIADMIPHHDYGSVGWGVVDVMAAVGVCSLISRLGCWPAVLAAGVGGVVPDLEVLWAYFHPEDYKPPNPRRRLIFPSHSGLLPHGKLDFPWGFLVQVAIIAMLLPSFARCYNDRV